MARPRAFDEAEVLDAAVACFWRHGLEASSVHELAAEMGLNCPSVYNAFGDKRALFAQALERYAERIMRERIRSLEQQSTPKDAIRAFFSSVIERSLDHADQRGCLIVNSAMEVAPHDAELRGVILNYLLEIETFFRGCIERGQALGEIAADLNPGDAARLFLGVMLGIRVAARTNRERALLEGMARPALALLETPNHSPAKGTK